MKVRGSIWLSIGHSLPDKKRHLSFSVVHFQVKSRKRAIFGIELELFVDEGIIESMLGGVRSRGGIEDAFHSRPVDCSKTHGTRFTAGIEVAILQPMVSQCRASGSNSENFRMCGRVAVYCYAIHAGGDDASLPDHQRPEWPAPALGGVVSGQLQSLVQKVRMHLNGLIFALRACIGVFDIRIFHGVSFCEVLELIADMWVEKEK